MVVGSNASVNGVQWRTVGAVPPILHGVDERNRRYRRSLLNDC